MPSHLLHELAMRRDQVCPSSNKGGCLLTHPLFAICKPDTFDRTAHLSPLPSRRLSPHFVNFLLECLGSWRPSVAKSEEGGGCRKGIW